MSEYLWDKSGEPDPEIEALETLLLPLGAKPDKTFVFPRRTNWAAMAVAASVLLLLGAGWFSFNRKQVGWHVSTLAGTAQAQTLTRGESLTTDAASRARLELPSVGAVEVEPNSQLAVVALGKFEQRLNLKRGKISAMIWAPPGQFVVNTPSATTVDLGCAYTLEVNDSGDALVKVTAGWVAFDDNGRESFIPATAACVTRRGKGPGTPYYDDATSRLRTAVTRFDESGDMDAVAQIRGEARPRDSITLWHLLRRVPPNERGPIFDRLAELLKLPANVNRQGVVRGDARMIDTLWDSLELGDTSWWRTWKTRTH